MNADAGPGLVTELDAESIEPLLRTTTGMVVVEFYSPDLPRLPDDRADHRRDGQGDD